MQDRYAADYGDFSKCGLLRRLTGSDLSVGLNWYLTDDESHNQDGRHIDYLSQPHRHFNSLLSCDPDLFRSLQKLITRGTRSVKALQSMEIWPQHTRFYDKRLSYQNRTPSERKTHRQQWFKQAVQTLNGVDLICLDPDNGLAVPSVSATHGLGAKYATLHEVSAFWDTGASLVIYQHVSRRSSARQQAEARLNQLKSVLSGVHELHAICFHRGTSRLYLIAMQLRHTSRLSKRISQMFRTPWKDHFSYVCPSCPGTTTSLH